MVVFNNKLIFGFSLAEALISMLVLSVFFLATSKIMTQRQPEDTVWHEHGYCACYANKITCSSNESKPMTRSVNGGQCKLHLPKNSNMYVLALITSDKVYERQQFINKRVTMTPSSFTVDGEAITNDIKDEDDVLNYQMKFDDYKTMLLKVEPSTSKFLTQTAGSPPAAYLAW